VPHATGKWEPFERLGHWAGFLLMVVSGVPLLAAESIKVIYNPRGDAYAPEHGNAGIELD